MVFLSIHFANLLQNPFGILSENRTRKQLFFFCHFAPTFFGFFSLYFLNYFDQHLCSSTVIFSILTFLPFQYSSQGKVQKKKIEKKLTSVSFMYVCVAENGEMLVFFSFFSPTIV